MRLKINLKEAVEKYGVDVWFASTNDPSKKLIKVIQVLTELGDDYIVLAEFPEGDMSAVRMKNSNPSNKFVLYGNT